MFERREACFAAAVAMHRLQEQPSSRSASVGSFSPAARTRPSVLVGYRKVARHVFVVGRKEPAHAFSVGEEAFQNGDAVIETVAEL